LALLTVCLLLSPATPAAPPPAAEKSAQSAVPILANSEPSLAELIPLATDLSARLTSVESPAEARRALDISDRAAIAADRQLETISAEVRQLREAPTRRYAVYAKLKNDLARESGSLERASQPLTLAINRLDRWEKEWRAEKARWSGWHAAHVTERSPEALRSTFAKALATIDAGQRAVQQRLEIVLAAQARTAEIQGRINRLSVELESLLGEAREQSLLSRAPAMYQRAFFTQFRRELWNTAWDKLTVQARPDLRFLGEHSLGMILLVALFFGLTVAIFRNRKALGESEHWGFVAATPFATGLFSTALPLAVLVALWNAPVTLRMGAIIVAGVSGIRLLRQVLSQTWMKQAASGIVLAFLISLTLFVSFDLPAPLARLYIVAFSLLALIFCVRQVGNASRGHEPRSHVWALRSGAALSLVILVGQVFGQAALASYVFAASLATLSLALLFVLFVHVIRGGVRWLFFASPVWSVKLLRADAEHNTRNVSRLIEWGLLAFVGLPLLLATWGVVDTYPEAVNAIVNLGFEAGAERISVGLVLAAIATVYGSLLAGAIVPKVLLDEQFAGRDMEKGARLSVGRLLQYFIVLVGFVIMLSTLGIEWTNLTIILSAFGVGIGFGLQSIVNNFVSGLILLFERPIREGDTINVGTERVHIKKIGLRATHVRTFEHADVIIPNANLVTNPVTNWTLGNREVRLSIPVGVSYGSDVQLVGEILLARAKEHHDVLHSPAPQVLFMNLGESSLNFELRVWIEDADQSLAVRSELYQDILAKFREAKIEIPFPQRDLHLRSVEQGIVEAFTLNSSAPRGERTPPSAV
jgi:small-conductance mechanosensitive channel